MKKSCAKHIFALLLYGSSGVVSTFISLPSTDIVLLRLILGTALLAVLFFAGGNRITAHHYKKDLLCILISGVGMAAEWMFLFASFSIIGVGLGTLINYAGPAIVIALSPLVFREKITTVRLAALAAALLGVVLISGQIVTDGLHAQGLFYAGGAAVGYAVVVLANKKAEQISGMENALFQLLFAALFSLIVSVLRAVFGAAALIPAVQVTDILPILWIGLINTGIGGYCYFSSMEKLPAQSVAVIGYVEPLFSVLLSALILGEQLTFIQGIGAVCIIGGALYGELAGGRRST